MAIPADPGIGVADLDFFCTQDPFGGAEILGPAGADTELDAVVAAAARVLTDFYAVHSPDKADFSKNCRIVKYRVSRDDWRLRLDEALLAKYGASPGLAALA